MIAYFDSSALVKLVIEEPGGDDAAAMWDAADVVMSSRVASPEVRAALGAARRTHRLTEGQLGEAKRLWSEFWGSLHVVELTAPLAHRAGDLAETHALSGFDAVHLASAHLIASRDVVVATWDVRLHTAALALRLGTLPERL